MDRFWSSRCLNDRIDLLDMMRIILGGKKIQKKFQKNKIFFNKKTWFKTFFIKVSSKFFLFKKNSSTKGAFYTCLYLSKLATNFVRAIKVPKVKIQWSLWYYFFQGKYQSKWVISHQFKKKNHSFWLIFSLEKNNITHSSLYFNFKI